MLENVPLSGYSTMRLGGPARYLTDITVASDIPKAIDWASSNNLPVIMIGDGSNIVWRDEGFPGLVLVNKLQKYEEFNEDQDNLYVTVGAGENWDRTVERCVATGFSGVEELSLIPGTAGATPIQNVGAYGREIKDVLVSVEAYDSTSKQFVNIPAMDCGFSYRSSKFKTTDKDRFFITSITLHLTKATPEPPFYSSLQAYLSQNNITEYSPQIIRDAVIAIRSAKLPDPAVVANNGSFFQNPIISSEQAVPLIAAYPDIVKWDQPDGNIKLSAAWLVEQAGFKDFHDVQTGMATWAKQPLVLVNEKAQTTASLLEFKQKIVDAVSEKFGITLVQEPELRP